MKPRQLFSILTLIGAWIALNVGPSWTQDTPAPGKSESQMKEGKGERTGKEKMEAGGTQEPGRTERKKGETEMEARGAQKPGRMEKSGAERPEAKDSLGDPSAKEDVRKAQEALKDKGHDPGSIDGVLGPQTRQAIRAFQKASGLKETGSLDSETAKKLGVERGTANGGSSGRGPSAKESTGLGKGQPSPTQKDPSSPAGK